MGMVGEGRVDPPVPTMVTVAVASVKVPENAPFVIVAHAPLKQNCPDASGKPMGYVTFVPLMVVLVSDAARHDSARIVAVRRRLIFIFAVPPCDSDSTD